MNKEELNFVDSELKKSIDELEGTKFLSAFYILDWIIKMNEKNKELHNKIDKLLKENESLRARIKTIKRLRKKQTQKKNKYKSIITNLQNALTKKNNKIDKAIEYMKDFIFEPLAVYEDRKLIMFNENLRNFEKILKDSDVE